jgi:hypothetical protein
VDGACMVGGGGKREEADLRESRIKFSSYFLRVEIQIYPHMSIIVVSIHTRTHAPLNTRTLYVY